MSNLLHNILCRINIHKWHYFYDPEYNRNGMTRFCEYCTREK